MPLYGLLLAVSASAQVFPPGSFSFGTTLISAGSDRARLTVDGDFNGDGVTDLVVASLGGLRLSLHEGLGNGRLAPARVLVQDYELNQLRVGDVDADGDLDVVMSARQTPVGGAVPLGPLWLENLGGGAFAPAPAAFGAPVMVPAAINIGDLDGDGDLDAVTVDFVSGDVHRYTFQGGGFGGPELVGSVFGFGPTDVVIADLNGDGAQDVVVAQDDDINLSSGALWLRNLGTGFAASAPIGSAVPRAMSVRALDVDQDGDLDVIVGTLTEAAIYRSLGQGNFASFPIQVDLDGATSKIDVVDVDGNGSLDIVGSSATGFPAHWAPNVGTLSYGAAIQVGPFQAAGAWTDLDGDGDPDWVYGARLSTGLSWLANDGSGGFGAIMTLEQLLLDLPSDVLFADLDADGDPDLIAAAEANGAIVWFENTGGTLALPEPVGVLAGVRRLSVGDVDLDGDLDVLAGGDHAAWFEQTATGFTVPPVPLGLAQDIVLADLNGDGLGDLLYRNTANIAWRPATAAGAFTNQVVISTDAGSSTSDILARDLDGDGDLDVLAAGNSVQRLIRIENLGANLFAPPESFSVPFSSTPVQRVGAEDLNSDGRVDLLIGASSFFWLKSLPGGGYATAQFIGSSSSSSGGGFAASDIDGDGDLDFAYASSINEPLVLWRELQQGASSSGGQLLSHSLLLPRALAMADIDADAAPDLPVPSALDQTVTLFLNHAPNITRYCSPAVPNQTGGSGRVFALGSPLALAPGLTLRATGMPSQSAGYFITSRSPGLVPNAGGSAGTLCLSGAIGRYVGPGQVLNTGPFGGAFELALDPTRTPSPTGFQAVMVGETWRFQAWYRDSMQGVPTSNFTDAIAIRFE